MTWLPVGRFGWKTRPAAQADKKGPFGGGGRQSVSWYLGLQNRPGPGEEELAYTVGHLSAIAPDAGVRPALAGGLGGLWSGVVLLGALVIHLGPRPHRLVPPGQP